MKFITVIPARAGSKQIKNKNIYKINKKPLIDYTFDAAKKSVLKNRINATEKVNPKINKLYTLNSSSEKIFLKLNLNPK